MEGQVLGDMASAVREPITGVWAELPAGSNCRATRSSGGQRAKPPWSWKLWSICTSEEVPTICCQCQDRPNMAL